MDKTELIKLLNVSLTELIKNYYLTESKERTLTSVHLQKPNDKKVEEMSRAITQSKQIAKTEINQLRGVIKELESGTITMI